MNWKVVCISVACLALVVFVATGWLWQFRTRSGPHNRSQVTINIIDQAISMYHSFHRQYPGKDLFKSLTGYGDDDGYPGYGYRVKPRGEVWGPWNGVHEMPTKGDPPHFVDYWGNEIEYHIFEDMSEAMKDYINASPPGEDPDYYRRDYVIRSRGPNGKWDKPRDPESDDVTNLWMRE